jgi:hypothetical protein
LRGLERGWQPSLAGSWGGSGALEGCGAGRGGQTRTGRGRGQGAPEAVPQAGGETDGRRARAWARSWWWEPASATTPSSTTTIWGVGEVRGFREVSAVLLAFSGGFSGGAWARLLSAAGHWLAARRKGPAPVAGRAPAVPACTPASAPALPKLSHAAPPPRHATDKAARSSARAPQTDGGAVPPPLPRSPPPPAPKTNGATRLVAGRRRAEAVRHQYRRPPRRQRGEALEYAPLCHGVERAGGLVKQQDAGVLQERAGGGRQG